MNAEEIVLIISTSILGLWIGGLELRITSFENRIRSKMSKEDAKDLIELKLDCLRQMQDEIKEDIKELRDKIDYIISSRQP